jgi:hypothetical protein
LNEGGLSEVEGDDLTVYDGFISKLFQGASDRGETVGEIFIVAREKLNFACRSQRERAIAVEFELV